jgi:hypothetical protein
MLTNERVQQLIAADRDGLIELLDTFASYVLGYAKDVDIDLDMQGLFDQTRYDSGEITNDKLHIERRLAETEKELVETEKELVELQGELEGIKILVQDAIDEATFLYPRHTHIFRHLAEWAEPVL